MAGRQSKPESTFTRPSARDLSSYQYHAIQQVNQTYDYVDTSSTGICNGILQNAPTATAQAAEIATGGSSLMIVDGNSPNISVGSFIGSNSSYHGVAVSSDKDQYFAVAMEASTADGDLIEVKLLGGPQYLAA